MKVELEKIIKRVIEFAPNPEQWGRPKPPLRYVNCLSLLASIVANEGTGTPIHQKIRVDGFKSMFAGSVAEDRGVPFAEVYSYLWEEGVSFPEWARDDWKKPVSKESRKRLWFD